jgi:hypothetical protein
MSTLLQRLKKRKLVQWALTYLAGAWVSLEVVDLVGDIWALPEVIPQVATVVLVVGFFAVLVLAWYHGEKGRQKVSGAELLLIAVLLAIGGVLISVLGPGTGVSSDPPRDDVLPLVVMMDSHHPRRVYDDETVAAGGTNADTISDILSDLPIRPQKEAIGPEWHRDEDVLGFRPDLIIIHYSGFRQEDSAGSRSRLRLFIEYFADSDTRFLIYSRRDEAVLRDAVGDLLTQLDQEHPGLLERVHVFGLVDYGGPRWGDPATAASLKLRVKRILAID